MAIEAEVRKREIEAEVRKKERGEKENRCFGSVVLETFESPLDSKEIQPVHPKGNQS